MTRQEAEVILRNRFGLDHFFDEQWLTIDKILRGERVLMVEKTGFGKSLCYQFPAIIFSGVTVVFSPLIALMRDQVRTLNIKGINAACINSEQTPEGNTRAIEDAASGRIKILYIAPERQENSEWIDAARNRIRMSMVVIDEAHTISVWGHDFRPAFRRIVNLVKLLDGKLPVLAVTATATPKVQEDIKNQIGGQITYIRGDLVRKNFRLRVVEVKSEDEKMIWLKNNINTFSGTGIIYAGTRAQSETYARWLTFVGVSCVYYNAGLDADSRKEIESGLMDNKWKCVISTNALGMGIDKPDIRFIIHIQTPASPIHYYQEIGRSGRDGLPTDVVLLYNGSMSSRGEETDLELPLAFINGSKPSIDKYNRVIEIIQKDLYGLKDICIGCNLKQTEFNVIKEDLIEQGIMHELSIGKSKKYEYVVNAPKLDVNKFQLLRDAKLADLQAMKAYIHTNQPRMKYLCAYLGDNSQREYAQCDNTNLSKLYVNATKEDLKIVQDFYENYFPTFSFSPIRGKVINGVAASYYGVSTVGDAIHRCKYENGGIFPDFLLRLTLKAFHKSFTDKRYDYILYVPPTKSGDLVKNFAERIGKILNIRSENWILKTRNTKEQKIFRNAYGKKDNVNEAFTLSEKAVVFGKNILLIDDIYDSGWTLREICKMLIQSGAAEVSPLTIAKTVGNDLD